MTIVWRSPHSADAATKAHQRQTGMRGRPFAWPAISSVREVGRQSCRPRQPRPRPPQPFPRLQPRSRPSPRPLPQRRRRLKARMERAQVGADITGRSWAAQGSATTTGTEQLGSLHPARSVGRRPETEAASATPSPLSSRTQQPREQEPGHWTRMTRRNQPILAT